MNEMRERLARCIQAVFPNLTVSEAEQADTDNVGDWDSVATVTLAAVIEEEFGVNFNAEEMEKLTSFQDILVRLNARADQENVHS